MDAGEDVANRTAATRAASTGVRVPKSPLRLPIRAIAMPRPQGRLTRGLMNSPIQIRSARLPRPCGHTAQSSTTTNHYGASEN